MRTVKDPTVDSLTTVNDDGSHYVLHPADVRGRFTVWRRLAAAVLIAVYVLLPWVQINGKPAVFLDAASLRFHLFGMTFAIQDMWLVFFLISGLGFTLFYLTALFGRLWCGWACPQTVFLEHVYRRIERWIEGDATSRRGLDRAPWTAKKWLLRGSKQLVFVVLSLAIAHVFLAYFVSIPRVWGMVTHSPSEHWGVFLFVAAATGIIHVNFAWFREQLCIVICPYGRLQSALLDDDSLVIGYDAIRGEPRTKLRRVPHLELSTPGDCIDCHRCVQVCPTGIDIRQGLQLECIGCANCIDACDEVMDKVGRPRGLVRYDSGNGLAGKRRRFLRPRTIVYSILMGIGAIVATLSISTFKPANMSAVRMSGPPYFVAADTVRNQFLVRVINKLDEAAAFTLRVEVDSGAPDGLFWSGWESGAIIEPGGEVVQPLIISVPVEAYHGTFRFRIEVESERPGIAMNRQMDFVGPHASMLRSTHEVSD